MKNVVSASVHSITTSGEQHLYLDGIDADKVQGKQVCLLDDVISTGESLHALETLMKMQVPSSQRKQPSWRKAMLPPEKILFSFRNCLCFRRFQKGEYEIIA